MGFSIFHLIGLMAVVSAIVALRFISGSKSWATQKLVLRAHHISFEPLPPNSEVGGIPLSDTARDLSQGEPLFAVVIGRPAGLINFLREGVGLSRRFEFVFSRNQAMTRYASFTTHALHCARLEGLNSIEVSRKRPNPLMLFGPFLLIFAIVYAISAVMTGGDDSDGITAGFVALAGCALYYFTQRVTRVSLREAGNPEICFEIFPPILERLFGRSAPELPLEDANRIVQIFRVLKGS
jgi:hypothetical protein